MKRELITVIIVIMSGIYFCQDKKSAFNCEGRVADTKTIIEQDMALLKDILEEVRVRQKELTELKLKKEKVEERINSVKTVAEWLGLNKEEVCGVTMTIPDPYLCTNKSYINFLKGELLRCKNGINKGCGTINTFLQIRGHITRRAPGGGGGGGGFPPIGISIPFPIGNVVVGGKP